MKLRNEQPNRWQKLKQRLAYWQMRSTSRKAWLFGYPWGVIFVFEYFLLFPRLEVSLARIIGCLTLAMMGICTLLYLNHGYQRHQHQ